MRTALPPPQPTAQPPEGVRKSATRFFRKDARLEKGFEPAFDSIKSGQALGGEDGGRACGRGGGDYGFGAIREPRDDAAAWKEPEAQQFALDPAVR
jgi:hypothetical protein